MCWTHGLNCVDASIELANDYDVPLMLIASRRQVDSDKFNGGYLNNWTTSKFADHVNKKNIKKYNFSKRSREALGRMN